MILLEGGFRNKDPEVATTRDVKSELKPEIRSVSNVYDISATVDGLATVN